MKYSEVPNISELLDVMDKEAREPSALHGGDRYRTRFLLLSSISQWNDVLAALRSRFHPQEIRLSTFCRGDVLPSLDSWREIINDEYCLLLPLWEVLRFHNEDRQGNVLTSFAQYTGNDDRPRRLYVPLLCTPEKFDYLLTTHCQRYEQGLLPPAWSLPHEDEKGCVVLAAQFPQDIPQTVEALPAYFALWEKSGVPASCFVRTNFVRRRPIAGDEKFVACHTERDVAAYFHLPDAPEAPDMFWKGLLRYARTTDTCLQQAACRLLKRSEFRVEDAVKALDESPDDSEEKWLIWETLRRESPCLETVWQQADSPDKVDDVLYRLPLGRKLTREAMDWRRTLLRRKPGIRPSAELLETFRALPAEERLDILSDASPEEQALIIETVGEMLAKGETLSRVRPGLETNFPLLAAYLRPLPCDDKDIQHYFQCFVAARLRNVATSELRQERDRLSREREDLPYCVPLRSSLLAAAAKETTVRWLDGLGLEWGCVAMETARAEGFECTLEMARANLPTTTAANHEWQTAREKVSTLDRLGHAPDYTFPGTFLKQLEAVRDFVRDMAADQRHAGFGSQVRRLALTGDHGLTPVVFHKDERPVPPGYSILKGGRALRRERAETAASDPDLVVEGENCYLRGLGRFAGGQRVGAIHGGATLEEVLVPILTLTRKKSGAASEEIPLGVEAPQEIRLSPQGDAILTLHFSRCVHDVSLDWSGRRLAPDALREAEAVFHLSLCTAGLASFSLYVEQKWVSDFSVRLLAGLELNDMGI